MKKIPKEFVTIGNMVVEKTGEAPPAAPPAAPVEAPPAASVEIDDLPGASQSAKPASFIFDENFADTTPAIDLTSEKTKDGCQCDKCKITPNRDKRGRHHKDCPCAKCNGEKQPLNEKPNFNDIATTAPAALTDYNELAGCIFDLSTGTLATVIGNEWQPKSLDERKMVVQPLAAYLKSKEIKDIPPGILLAIVVSTYSAQRIAVPNTKLKLYSAWLWIKAKFTRKKV